ncbi:IS30 family transposase [Zhongshania antarctica]|jgi:hypothetical protein|uniref:IS30 family transposase n=1 Tax=Zhongshania antarctica TaxID=641702 RepID=A0A840R9T1_9GAMM|nr:hypothetical protein [Zhongshania antarctica]MBB5189183.1 IS30 family transposase [Zhongshania antarctica]
MRHIKEIRRLKLEAKLSHRQIARSLGIGVGTVSTYGKRAAVLGLCWPLPAEMSGSDLEPLLFPSPQLSARHGRVMPDCAGIHLELKRKGSPNSCCGRSTNKPMGTRAISARSLVGITANGAPRKTLYAADTARR